VETDGAKRFDFVITVSADEDVRRRRLIERGMKDYEITKRLAAQVDDTAREAIAHFVIRNNSSIEELRQAIQVLWRNELLPRRTEQ
jgi:dephospho-CoA kinase